MKEILKNKVAIITGSSKGIGLSIALKLGQMGCKIAICSRYKKNLEKASKKLLSKNIIFYSQEVDLTKKNLSRIFFNKVIKKFGKVDILINNFGGEPKNTYKKFKDTDINVWKECINNNLLTSIFFIDLSLPYMKKNKWGRIINIASLSAYNYKSKPWYVVSKRAQIELIKSLSIKKEYVQNGITFNSVSPGATNTDDSIWNVKKKKNIKKFNKNILDYFTMGRLVDPEEIANVVGFLSSADSSYVNGIDIKIDGGQSNLSYNE